MRKRLLYGTGVVLLLVTTALVIWQGSFNLGEHAPADPTQTFIFWAVSTLIFVLMVTLGFILGRTAVKLYVERQSHREGSRIKTRLVLGALALSIIPVVFLVLFSYHVLNRNLVMWFGRPADIQRMNFKEIGLSMDRLVADKARAEAALLASHQEIRDLLINGHGSPGFLARFCDHYEPAAVAVLRPQEEKPLDSCGPLSVFQTPSRHFSVARFPFEVGGKTIGIIHYATRVPVDVVEKQFSFESFIRFYDDLAANRRNFRNFYLLFLALITLFILFVATWIALFLARQISVPISAVLRVAEEVRKGNLTHRVEVQAIDELAVLVRGFNEMTRELEANSRELDARRRFTEAILENIPTGVISLSSDGSILRINRALKALFPKASLDKAARLEDLFSREDAAEIKYLMKRARRTGLAARQLDLKTGNQTLHLAVTVSALEESLTSGFVVVLEDTTDLLRAQQAVAWHEVARRVAHEIKNPLTPIALSAERMGRQLDRLNPPPEVARILRECTATIMTEVESVKTLVDEFSQFARFPAAQPVRSDLNEVVEAALAVFAGRLEGIEMRTQLSPGLPAVNIDREQFKRVVVNLVDNAAEAMQDSLIRQLFIATQTGAGGTVELLIADSGRGVSAEDKEKLFLPYFSTKGRGTGLGLAIVNHILNDHNARIRVEDNDPVGASFTIEIPAVLEGTDDARTPEAVAARI
ncbi:MAG: ATP-binding protein [Bryobacteraceae bacterium]